MQKPTSVNKNLEIKNPPFVETIHLYDITPRFIEQNMKKNLLALLVVLGVSFASAQEQTKPLNETEKLEKLKGTFSILAQQRVYELPSNLSVIIEKNRLADKQNVIQLSSEVVLVIYPSSQIVNQEPKATK
ncbi:MAG: hypothetical protein M9931_00255 [Chitinophagales bacterium]|nr:hypothetical protein [Chitinophagales bacterium]MCO5279467.1 hypothetical protein [Chitinophagales bacterium]OJV24421.1 MAG: hypothetical protein BGO32_01735 [Bacteroidetes bacterium 37-13]HRN95352.1 hypothetical protein [Chitinophagales bacterium]HRP39315.1 hypothetical protein [Chitinophagales bacterium]